MKIHVFTELYPRTPKSEFSPSVLYGEYGIWYFTQKTWLKYENLISSLVHFLNGRFCILSWKG